MSLVGTCSPPETCQSCGGEYGNNVVHLGDVDFERSFHPNVGYTGTDPDGRLYVCDRCMWIALYTQFGYLLPERYQVEKAT